MSNEKASNFNISTNASITEEWNSGYKLELDLTSDIKVKNWLLDFYLPHNIREVYSVDLIDNSDGNYTISGSSDWQTIKPDNNFKAIFIVDSNGQDTAIPKFTKVNRSSGNNSYLSTNSEISEDWYGGYKLKVNLTSDIKAKNWSLDFDFPYSIDEVYGVDLTDNGNGNYTISGQGEFQDLNAGDSLDSVFIIDDGGGKAQTPQFSNSAAENQNNLMSQPVSQPVAVPETPQLSDKAISVGFEGHSHGTTYDYSAQSQDWDVIWSTQMAERASISKQESHSGNNSLQITYPSDEQSNVGAKWQVPEQQEYYLSYWLKFEDNFDFDGDNLSGGKLPGLGTGDLASGGNEPDGTNGFTSRYMWREEGQAVLYLYHMDQEGIYGDDLLLKSSDGEEKFFEPGQWHNLVQRVRINDSTKANGEIDVWMDNEQVLDVDNLRFVTNGQGIDTTFFSSFHGGYGSKWWPEEQGNAYFDDFVVSTNAHDVGL